MEKGKYIPKGKGNKRMWQYSPIATVQRHKASEGEQTPKTHNWVNSKTPTTRVKLTKPTA